MKTGLKLFAVLGVLLLMPLAAAHENAVPKITPDKSFYGLSVALDKLSLALTFDNHRKATKGLEIAHERLLEVKAMREAGKLDQAEISANNYAATVGSVSASIDQLKSVTAEKETEDLSEIEEKLAETDDESNSVSSGLSVESETSGYAKEKIDRINKINEKISAHKQAIEKLEARKAKLREKVPEDKLKEIEKRHEKISDREAKAKKEIADADAEIMNAESVAGNLVQGEKLLMNARGHLAKANEAFSAKKYGEAFGQANAAFHLARAIVKRTEQIAQKEQRAAEKGKNNSQIAKENKTSETKHAEKTADSSRGSENKQETARNSNSKSSGY